MKAKIVYIFLVILMLTGCSTTEKLNDEINIVKEEVTENNPITNETQNGSEQDKGSLPNEERNNSEQNQKQLDNEILTEEVTPIEKEEAPSVVEETKQPEVTPTPPESTPEENEPPLAKPETTYLEQVEQLIFALVNQERTKAGVSSLSYSHTMQKYARIKSQDMGVRGYFDHKDPQGRLITDQMGSDGVSYQAWGENIAYIGGQTDANALANQFMTNWMNSSGHRENILSTNFTEIGIGVYQSGNTVYATQEFYR